MPAPIGIVLSHIQRRRLLRRRDACPSPHVWKRITAILLLAARTPMTRITEALSVTPPTLLNWKRRWLGKGERGLDDAARSGRPPRITPLHISILLQAVRKDPADLGYAFRRWTAPRLCEYLFERMHVRVTAQWISELLRRHGFVWRRTKRTIRNLQDPVATKRAARALKRLKKGLSTPRQTGNSGLRMGYGSIFSRSSRAPIASVDALCESQLPVVTRRWPSVEPCGGPMDRSSPVTACDPSTPHSLSISSALLKRAFAAPASAWCSCWTTGRRTLPSAVLRSSND